MNHIFFGFKGVGKTFWGLKKSKELQCPFYDLDNLIKDRYKKPIREIFQEYGEKKFRQIEKEELIALSNVQASVIALGGGTVLDPDNVKLLQTMGSLYYLRASFETIQARLDQLGLPVFVSENKSLKQIYDERLPIYEAIPATWINV